MRIDRAVPKHYSWRRIGRRVQLDDPSGRKLGVHRRSAPRVVVAMLLLLAVSAAAKDRPKEDPSSRFLDHVQYLITPEEKKDWLALADEAERAIFIARFWALRAPPGLTADEVRVEHDRRVEYADRRFAAGYRGSKTDRGRVYIMLGPPATIARIAGGLHREAETADDIRVTRGDTASMTGADKPGEIWTYRHIPGAVTSTNELQFLFIDRYYSGNFELVYDLGDNDRLAFLSSDPLLAAEFEPSATHIASERDIVGIQRELRKSIIERRKEKIEVATDFSLEALPATVWYSVFRRGDVMRVPFVVSVPLRELSLTVDGNSRRGRVSVHGRVRSASGADVQAFEAGGEVAIDDGTWRRRAELSHQIEAGIELKPGNYQLELVLVDSGSGRVAIVQQKLDLVAPTGSMQLSSVLLASRLEPRSETAGTSGTGQDPFVFGDLKLSPLADGFLSRGTPLGVYFHIYDPRIEPDCQCPDVLVDYALRPSGSTTTQRLGDPKRLTREFAGSARTITVGRRVDLGTLAPGRYELIVYVQDRIDDTATSAVVPFEVR